MKIPDIRMPDYDYELPQSRIAQVALETRDKSKLLVYLNNEIKDSEFRKLPSFLPKNATLFYNDAKVIPARIFIKKESGTTIEIFLLRPSSSDYFTTLNSTSNCRWECLVGNKKKWKEGETLSVHVSSGNETILLTISWQERENNTVHLSWEKGYKFIALLEQMGKMPLPPYIKREAELNDTSRYQTIYSTVQGSVAAPTAGLHFTEDVLQDMKKQGIDMFALTLHVSAGTFLPVSVDKANEHQMHQEIFSVTRELLLQLKKAEYIVAVGTTSVRVLESLYWCAVKIKTGKENPFEIEKLVAYETEDLNLNADEAITLLLDYMNKNKTDCLTGATSIMILPGYTFRFVKGLITNFHQPKSTLILLIAAFVGEQWRNIYNHALGNDYRFLSYGDSSLLLK